MKSIIHAARMGTSEVHTKNVRKSSYLPLEKEIRVGWILTGAGNCLTADFFFLNAAMKYRIPYKERMFDLHFHWLRWKVAVSLSESSDRRALQVNCFVIWHEDCPTFISKWNSECSPLLYPDILKALWEVWCSHDVRTCIVCQDRWNTS